MVSTRTLSTAAGLVTGPVLRIFRPGGLRFPNRALRAGNRSGRQTFAPARRISMGGAANRPFCRAGAALFDLAAVTFAELLPFILVGFAAQLVDGALGMAFGVISSTLLVSLGVPPAAASASVHAVEVFTTGASGISHTLAQERELAAVPADRHPRRDRRHPRRLCADPGPAEQARPFVLAYLAVHRPLSALARPPPRPSGEEAAHRRAARPGRRLPRRGRRRRLGPGRDLATCSSRARIRAR